MWKMKPDDRDGRRLSLGSTCLVAGLVLAAAFATGWRNEQAHFGDLLVQMAPKPLLPFGISLIGIDASSLNLDQQPADEIESSPPLRAMKKGYPWSRAVYADVIERLMQAGARLVFLDILMVGPREGDEDLRKVLEKYGDRVVLISTFAEDASGAGHTIIRYQMPSETVVASAGTPVGFANVWRDEDQVLRVAPFRLTRHQRKLGAEESVPSAAALMLGLLGGKERQSALPDEAAFIPGKQALQRGMVPLWKLFIPGTWEHDLKNGEVFRDKIVAIGSYFTAEHDEFQTAAGGAPMPGFVLHLAILSAAWHGAFYSMPSLIARGSAALLASLAAWLVALVFRNILLRSLAYAACIALIFAGGVGALVWLHVQLPVLPLLSGLLVGGVGTLAVDLITERKARHRARRMLERYVSPGLAREVLDRRDSLLESLGGSHREVTVLFADLRGFTTLAESTEPVQLLADLNDYLGRMTALIFEAGGGVDKFLGDGILAVWGTLDESSSAPALECSKRMLAELDALNAQRVLQGKPEWRLGIGIHKGTALFGNVGSHKKMELTVIGDTVNLASRTEGLNKAYSTEILFTTSVRDGASGAEDAFRPVDRIRVMGRSQAVDLFTFWEPAIPQNERLAYETAIEDYRSGEFARAASAFAALQEARPADALYGLYAKRSLESVANPPQGPWDGTSKAKSK